LDYYGLMTRSNRILAFAMVASLACCSAFSAPAKEQVPNNSILNSQLFYQLLVGELSAASGDASAAYSLMLDAARKTNSEQLYERAVELALAARSGESALQAAQAWTKATPASRDANRYLLQILIGLNRIADTVEPVQRDLAALAPKDRTATITLLPRYFAQAKDKKAGALAIEQALAAELTNTTTGPVAWAAIGRLRMLAEDPDGALDAARRGAALNPRARDPLALALTLMSPKVPGAEEMVRKYLSGKAAPEVRMEYARKLLEVQRYTQAYVQIKLLNREKPGFADAWLVRGSLELQNKNLPDAEASLKKYVAVATALAAKVPSSAMGPGLVQAYLLLAQIAEQNLKPDQAQDYLQRIDSPKDALRVQTRRASILARQGKMEEALNLIRNSPETLPEDARAKISAEVQLLRDNKQYQSAYQLLASAIKNDPKDMDLIYEQAMVAEKLGRTDEMEQLLREIISKQPEYHHAYNALGYLLADRNSRLPEARALIKKALEFAPNDPFILDSLAWLEFRSGNSTEALRILQNAFQARPDAEIAAHLGEVLWTTGQREQATAIWTKGLGLNPDNETLLETMRRLRDKL
jgi:tetratricopeptide (TPR) repeat protein